VKKGEIMSSKDKFMNWDNPGTALVTGASAGIGAEFARQLAERGFDLVLVARRKNRLEALGEKLSREYSIQTEVLVADLSTSKDMDRVVSKILKLDNLSVLINNAGYGINTPFLDREYKQNVEMINVHYTGPVMFCQAALKGMIERGRGVIINNASASAIARYSEIYSSSKAAITIFSEILNSKVRGKDIHIQALCPGFTHSEFHDSDSMEGVSEEDFSEMHWMSAEEVVTLSLKAVKSKQVIFIPGEENRALLKSVRKSTFKKYLECKIF
jgi:short-subunit dehydrogenase